MQKLPITCIILTHRNDDRFVKCLESAQFMDQVIIVDHSSNNNWQELRQTLNFEIIEFQKDIESFAEVRNWSMQFAKHDWVLFLDSDEVLEDGSNKLIEEILNQKLYDGIYLNRKDVFLDKQLDHGEAGNQEILRLFDKNLTQFKNAVHEVAITSGRLGRSEIIILHYSHNSISEFLESVVAYATQIGREYKRDHLAIFLELLIFPPAKFVFNYFLRLGFLDGYRGLVYAVMMSLHSLIVRAKAYEIISSYDQKTQP